MVGDKEEGVRALSRASPVEESHCVGINATPRCRGRFLPRLKMEAVGERGVWLAEYRHGHVKNKVLGRGGGGEGHEPTQPIA